MDEYNNLVLINDELPVNSSGQITITNNATLSEVKGVSEISEKVIEESGSTHTASITKTKSTGAKTLSAAVSGATVTASAATIVAAVLLVMAVSASGAAMPNASVTGTNVTYYNGSDIRVEFVLEDEEDELESFYAWIEVDGAEIICEVSAGSGAYFADAALSGEASGELFFVVYATSNDGWEGELYRGLIDLPTAPDISVEYEASYTAESGELVIVYEITDEGNQLSGYTVHLFDANGEIESTVDYSANTITVAVTDTAVDLYLVVNCEASNGWTGEVFKDAVTIPADDSQGETTDPTTPDEGETTDPTTPDEGETTDSATPDEGETTDPTTPDEGETTDPTMPDEGETTDPATPDEGETTDPTTSDEDEANDPEMPDVGVEYSVLYNAESSELIVTYYIYDDSGQLSGYTVQMFDADGNEVESTVDYELCTITATAAETTGVFNLVIEAASVEGWTGELYRAEIDITSLAPSVEVTGAAVTLYSNETDLTVQFTIEDESGELAYHEAYISDSSGNTAVCALTIDGYAFTASADVSSLDTAGGLTLTVYVISNTGWEGELYSGALTLPEAPTEAGFEIMYIYDGDSGELVASFEIYDHGGELSGYSVKLTDSDGGEVESTIDESAGTLTAAITDSAGVYCFVVYVTTVDGWYGEIYSEEITIPTAPDVGEIEIGVESLYESGAGGEVYLYISYTGDTSSIYGYEYWIEDANGQIYTGAWSDEYGCVIVTLTADDNLETDAEGQLYVVISVSTYDYWQGVIYRGLQYI